MIRRCENPANKDYHDYGGRGIRVCERWRDRENGFTNFLADMGARQSASLSLDRIDNNGNYEPDNCRWASQADQNRNQRRTVLVSFNGAPMPLTCAYKNSGLSRAYGIKRPTNKRSCGHPHYLMLQHMRYKNATQAQHQIAFDILRALFQAGLLIHETHNDRESYLALRNIPPRAIQHLPQELLE